ncbi:UNVERIFIED_CONTAM: hypothetical protein GTU68_027922 [Idotea baltica]|nr:hypothetical protein [Idotea baltica]
MGEHKLTKEFRPWVLLYSKVFTSKLEAVDHENYLKTEEGNEFLKKII